jgi:hypothetical protein
LIAGREHPERHVFDQRRWVFRDEKPSRVAAAIRL